MLAGAYAIQLRTAASTRYEHPTRLASEALLEMRSSPRNFGDNCRALTDLALTSIVLSNDYPSSTLKLLLTNRWSLLLKGAVELKRPTCPYSLNRRCCRCGRLIPVFEQLLRSDPWNKKVDHDPSLHLLCEICFQEGTSIAEPILVK